MGEVRKLGVDDLHYGADTTSVGGVTIQGLQPIDARFHGVIGDGVTDDTSSLNLAYAAAAASGGSGTLYLPIGTYLITDTLVWNQGVNIIGDGGTYLEGGTGDFLRQSSTIKWGGSSGGTIARIDGIGRGGVLSNIFFDGNGKTADVAIDFDETSYSANFFRLLIENCYIHDSGIGIRFGNVGKPSDIKINNCFFGHNTMHLSVIDLDVYNLHICDTSFYGDSNTTHTLYNKDGKVYFHNCYFGPTSDSVAEIYGDYGLVYMDTCYSEAHGSYIVKATKLNVQTFGIVLQNSWFANTARTDGVAVLIDSTVSGAPKVSIANSYITGSLTVNTSGVAKGVVLNSTLTEGILGTDADKITTFGTKYLSLYPEFGSSSGKIALHGTSPTVRFAYATDNYTTEDYSQGVDLTNIGNSILQILNPGYTSGLKLDFASYANKWSADTAAPTSGTWSAGDIVWNRSPSAGGTIGWVCTVAGTPGTWKSFGDIAS